MTEKDIEQTEQFIQRMTEKTIEGQVDYEDIRNMIQTMTSQNAEIRMLTSQGVSNEG